MDRLMSGLIVRWINGWLDGLMVGWNNGWMDGGMD